MESGKGIKFNFNTDAKKVKESKEAVNSNELSELSNVEPVETPETPVELIDNVSKESEDTQEATEEAEEKKAVVTYVGNGTWRDGNGKIWSRTEKPNIDIVATRSYSKDEYDEREDIKFMVKYGAMKVTLV